MYINSISVILSDPNINPKHAHKPKDRVTRTPPKNRECSGRVNSSCCISGIRCVNLDTNPMISHEWGKDREVFTTSGTYSWSFVTQIFHKGQPSHGGDHKTFKVMTSNMPNVFWGKGIVNISHFHYVKLCYILAGNSHS